MDKETKRYFFKMYFYSKRLFVSMLSLFLLLLLLFHFLFEESRAVLSYLIWFLLLLLVIGCLFDMCFQYRSIRHLLLDEDVSVQTPLEALLLEKMQTAQQEKRQLSEEQHGKRNELLDYYTLWVHQIKTPIAASQLLVQEVQEETLKKQLEQELFKIDSYSNLVLQYLRLESFHDDLVIQLEPLDEMVKEVVRKYAIFFIRQGLRLDLHNLEHSVVTDKKWLLVILEQVLSNSLKYTQEGGIDIYFDKDTLYIKDTGLGIKDSDVLRVFERGFSGYNGRLTQQSSGLGLYLSKKIADQLGHTISIESFVGQGTTVKIGFHQPELRFD